MPPMSVDDEGHGNLSLFEPHEDPDGASRRRWASRPARPDVQIRRSRRRRLRGRIVPLIAIAIIAVVVISGYTIVRHFFDGFAAKDYQGTGSGSVVVHITDGSTTGTIARLMVKDDVVASTKAFENAAGSKQFQAGYFKMHRQMSGRAAVALLLLPSSRLSTRVTIPEGFTEKAILARLSTQLKLPLASLQKAAAQLKQLGIPAGFIANHSAEGFLFPSTYDYPPKPSPADALVSMTGQFGVVVRGLNFVAAAKRLHYTPYQVLIIASMIEAEAKFPADRAKVARVVYNRLAARMPLGFDSTSAYGARLVGKDPIHINYNLPAPYNTRLKPGLPPTPIDNPGSASMRAAISPVRGNWIYFVSADKAGHLFFTNDARAFAAASTKCKTQHWGCI
jgi:UPF0755 protein